jgi:hypothetical protein
MVRNAKLHSIKEEMKTLKVAFILLRTRQRSAVFRPLATTYGSKMGCFVSKGPQAYRKY